ncbi:ABC transporter permease [Rhizobium wenxiniae]|uniref:Osmoprotectant transport system permease protein n=2 Tax=Rhizobium wenxiniae TaxID=1737357 RepID=A0A7X0D2X1_9HYPH|nr:osmoprotectant transport system permease protein [Rhizobium wenxiniae]GGG10803.1 ABC transporter permease [Rhizobium wenxiniae]
MHKGRGLEKTGVLMAALILVSTFLLPFIVVKPNRILEGQGQMLIDALPSVSSIALAAALVIVGLCLLLRLPASARLAIVTAALLAVILALGSAANAGLPPGNSYARVSPGSGFWLLLFALSLAFIDVIAKLKLSPTVRLMLLLIAIVAVGGIFASGILADISVMKEYANRADAFWAEMSRHAMLALGSMLVAFLIGLPLGVVCHRVSWLRAAALNMLNILQTIPSIALFGLLILPLGWMAAHIPGAAAIGISGIGTAPAFVALVLYSLLPVVANTVAGLENVPREANDAARGAGMTDLQRLFSIEFPLTFPSLLAAIRIVLIQNIGMATIAALIGGGGMGVFVFQGLGQSAMDLVLLGALPTVAMSFVAAIVLDALVDFSKAPGSEVRPA